MDIIKRKLDVLNNKLKVYSLIYSFLFLFLIVVLTILIIFNSRKLNTLFTILEAIIFTLIISFLLYFIKEIIIPYKEKRSLYKKGLKEKKEFIKVMVLSKSDKVSYIHHNFYYEYMINENGVNRYLYLEDNDQDFEINKEYEIYQIDNILLEVKKDA